MSAQPGEVVLDIVREVLDGQPVAPDDDLFDLGFDSLLVARTAARVRERLRRGPAAVGLLRRRHPRRPRRGDQRGRRGGGAPVTGVRAPLTPGQHRLWFLTQLDGGAVEYHIPLAWRLRGPLDAGALADALVDVVDRHDALRTRFPTVDGEPFQEVVAHWRLPVEVHELTGGEAEATERVALLTNEPFDLAAAPPVRAAVLRLGPDEHVLCLALHHVVVDAWSLDILFRELAACYAARCAGRAADLPALPLGFLDHARAVAADDGSAREESLRYWSTRLAGARPLDWVTDRPRPATRSTEGAFTGFPLPDSARDDLRALCRAGRTTPFMTVLALYQALLGLHTGQDDVCVGSPLSARDRSALEPVVGFFLTTIVLRGDLSGDPSFRELLARVKATTVAAYEHRDVPVEELTTRLGLDRDPARTPLFDTMLIVHAGEQARLRAARRAGRVLRPRAPAGEVRPDDGGLRGRPAARGGRQPPDRPLRRGHGRPVRRPLRGPAAARGRRTRRAPVAALPQRGARGGTTDPVRGPRPRPRRPGAPRRPGGGRPGRGGRPRRRHRADLPRAGRTQHPDRGRAAPHRSGRRRGGGGVPGAGRRPGRGAARRPAGRGRLPAAGPDPPAAPARARAGRQRRGGRGDHVGARPGLPLDGRRALLLDEPLPPPGRRRARSTRTRTPPPTSIYTSGSTGRPRRSRCRTAALASRVRWMAGRLRLAPGDRVLQFASLRLRHLAEELLPGAGRRGDPGGAAGRRVPSCPTSAVAARAAGSPCSTCPPPYWPRCSTTSAPAALAALRLLIVGGEAVRATAWARWLAAFDDRARRQHLRPDRGHHIATAARLTARRRPARRPIGRPLAGTRVHVLDDRTAARCRPGAPASLSSAGPAWPAATSAGPS